MTVPPELQQRLKASITGFCADTIRPVVDADKIVWNARIRRNEMYYRGEQYPIYAMNNGVVDYQSIGQGQPMRPTTGQQNSDLSAYVQNFFQGDVDTFGAVLGSKAPNCQAQARDLQNEAQVRLKMKADRVGVFLGSHWNVPLLHSQVVRGLALYGTMFSYTRFTTNQRKFGTTDISTYSVENVPLGNAYYQCFRCGTETPADQAQALAAQVGMPPEFAPCSRCGSPMGPESLIQPESMPTLVQGTTTQYPNGSVELSILNPAHITTKISAPDLDKAPWLICETEDDKGALIHAYPELREKAYNEAYAVSMDLGGAMGRWTRELLKSPAGYVIPQTKANWLHTQIWIAPTTFEYLPNDREGGIRDWLLANYPDGFKVPMVNGELLVGDPQRPTKEYPEGSPNRMQNERLTSVWAACKPKPTEMIYADPYFECMIQMQDTINDCLSMGIEQMQTSNPFVVVDPEIVPPDMVRAFKSDPGLIKFAKKGTGRSFNDSFFTFPASVINPELFNIIDKAISWCREVTGIVPAIFGGGDGPEQTAYEANLKHNQALMKLNAPWKNLRAFWAKTTENGIYQAAKYSNGNLFSSNQHGIVESEEVDGLWELADGGWYMQCEETMPQTIGERKAWIMNAYTSLDPVIQEKIGMNEPDNIIKQQEAIGMSDWTFPGYNEVSKLHQIINQLMQGEPLPGMPGPPDPMTGMSQPGPSQPSIPFDVNLFDPNLALKVLRSWLLSDKATQSEGTPGFQNVQAYFQAILAAMPPQMPQPKPPNFSVTTSLNELTPEAQQAFFQSEGINIAPGTLIALPPPPKMIGAGQPEPQLEPMQEVFQ